MQKKTFHYASHAWSLPTVRHSLTAGNQIHRLQKQIKSPNCSRQYTENETKPLGINFFRGIQRFCVILGFALAAVMGRKKGKRSLGGGGFIFPHCTVKGGHIIPRIFSKAMKSSEDAPNLGWIFWKNLRKDVEIISFNLFGFKTKVWALRTPECQHISDSLKNMWFREGYGACSHSRIIPALIFTSNCFLLKQPHREGLPALHCT